MKLLEKFNYNVLKFPNKEIYSDYKGAYTNYQVDILSGKVYAFLNSKGFGSEDVIAIQLPHSADIAICEIGIWKCGAVVLIMGEWISKEDKEFFIKDANVKFIIDEQAFNEIKEYEYKPGYKEPNEHDAAYIVYTSGTTGKFKGCVHEYGGIDKIAIHMKDFLESYGEMDDERAIIFSPLYDIGSFNIIVTYLYNNAYVDIAPFETYKDVNTLSERLKDKKITNMGIMTVKLKKIMEEGLLEKYNKFTYITTGYEPVKNIYSNKVQLYNCYGMSESSVDLAWFKIDKKYSITPAGTTYDVAKIVILDEEDKKLPNNTIGEICYPNPFFRGYLNLEDETKKAFRNGIFHSGDMGKILPNNDLVVYGRKSDINKINGEYVIPAIIEATIEKTFNISDIIVKIKNEKIYAYYEEDINYSETEMKEKLINILSDKMIPNKFIKVEQLPKSFSGKHLRRVLGD